MDEKDLVVYLVERWNDYGDGFERNTLVVVGVFWDKADAEKYVKYMELKEEFHRKGYCYGINAFSAHHDDPWMLYDLSD